MHSSTDNPRYSLREGEAFVFSLFEYIERLGGFMGFVEHHEAWLTNQAGKV
jgi:hypothetical protein